MKWQQQLDAIDLVAKNKKKIKQNCIISSGLVEGVSHKLNKNNNKI